MIHFNICFQGSNGQACIATEVTPSLTRRLPFFRKHSEEKKLQKLHNSLKAATIQVSFMPKRLSRVFYNFHLTMSNNN